MAINLWPTFLHIPLLERIIMKGLKYSSFGSSFCIHSSGGSHFVGLTEFINCKPEDHSTVHETIMKSDMIVIIFNQMF